MKELTKKQREQIITKIKSHPSGKVKVAVADIDGVMRGKILHIDKFISIVEKGFGFCDVVFGWDMCDESYDNVSFTGWHSGYPDTNVKLDLRTFRSIPWDQDLPFVLGDFVATDGTPLTICPRSLLNKIRNQSLEQGFVPLFAQEFEWFNFNETPENINDKNYTNIQPLTPGMFGYSILRSSLEHTFFNDLFDMMSKFRVPLEGLHTETGPGVYEAGIIYTDVLEAADRAFLFKTGTKEIAYRHGIMASFMAKWKETLPGCSGHLHQSLWNKKQSKNLFYDVKDPLQMSELMKSYLAGVLHCLPHVLPLYAPTINSYKRLAEGAWAPTTPTWAIDNRTTAIRVLNSSAASARIENRVVGSDVNPYLAIAASLASGLYGIRNKLKLKQPQSKGSGYQDKRFGILPGDLNEATQLMKHSTIATELFGETFVNHFVQTREWEWRQFKKVVTDWELRRYFEII